MNPQKSVRCRKMYMLNKGVVELTPSLREMLITNNKGLFAGGDSEKDLMDCPKMGQSPHDICKDCLFSIPVDSTLDDFGV